MKHFFISAGRFFRRNWVWSLCLVMALTLMIWLVGPLLAVNDHRFWASPSSRLLTISLMFLGWGLAMVFVSWRAGVRKKANEEDEDYQARQQREERIIEEHLTLHGRFREALRTLRRSSLYSGHSDRRRRELPWYLIIGPEGAGKTSLLDFSGLEFPLNMGDKQRLTRDVISTRHADWYFAEHAILIDTAGRYLTHDDPEVDAAGWQCLLGLLRKRRLRSLNGVLVSVPVNALLGDSELELETLARQTRQRLHDINQRLGADVPVYLVLSKADQLPGFDEFFDQMSREESDQVLGASFRKDQNGTDAGVVHKEFEELMRRLNSQVVMRMHQERDSQRRGRILDFPLQLGQLGERLGLFIELAFSGNRYQRASQLRGFYLTSAPQILDPMGAGIGSLHQAGGKLKGSLPAFQASHGRFINHLLSRVIFPESELAGLDQGEIRRINWGQRVLYTAALGCLIVFGVVWGHSFSANHQKLERLQAVGLGLTGHKELLSSEDDALGILQALDISYAATQVFAPQRPVAWTERAGLYQGGKVAPLLHANYRADLERLLLSRVGKQLEKQILANLTNRDSLLGTLRAYLMLNMPERRNPAFLQAWMAREWSLSHDGNTAAQQGLNQHFERLLEESFTPYPLDDELVADARAQLRSESLATVVYRMLREQAADLPEYRLSQHLGPQSALLTALTTAFPAFSPATDTVRHSWLKAVTWFVKYSVTTGYWARVTSSALATSTA